MEAPPLGHIWIILTKSRATLVHYHLVSIRWPTDMNDSERDSTKVDNLFKDTMRLISHIGLDVRRNNVSNGLIAYHKYNVLKLLKLNAAFIRKGKGVKIVKIPTKWNFYYITAGEQGKSEHMVNKEVATVTWKPIFDEF